MVDDKQVTDDKQTTSFRLTREARALLREVAKLYGLRSTSMLEILIREKARELGVALKGSDKEK